MDSTLQSRLHLWRQRNFPTATAEEQLLGVVEEVGELSHAVLKRKQGIRGFDDPVKANAAIEDAVGDILIYLAGFCSYEGMDMQRVYETTAIEVSKRDWITDPKTGGVPTGTTVKTSLRNEGKPGYSRLDN